LKFKPVIVLITDTSGLFNTNAAAISSSAARCMLEQVLLLLLLLLLLQLKQRPLASS
jgi:hypothetical protein